MIEAHLKKLRIRDEVSAQEEAAMRAATTEVRTYRADKTIIRRGQELSESMLLIDGWVARTKDLSDGQRQISELSFAGDFVDLHGFTLKRLDHHLVAITECRMAIFPHDRVRALIDRFPHLGRLYWMMTNIDAAIHREWTLSLGRRSSRSRMAHLFCEIRERLDVVGLVQDDSFDFPLTQQELGECLGLTPVHVNRTIQALRKAGLIRVENRRATILDVPGLKTLAEFDPDYLYLDRRPR